MVSADGRDVHRAPVLHGEAMTLPAAADHPVHSSTTDLRPAGTSVEADLFGVAPDAAAHPHGEEQDRRRDLEHPWRAHWAVQE